MKKLGSKLYDRVLSILNIVMVLGCVFDSIYFGLKERHVIFPVLSAGHISTLAEARNLSDAVFNRSAISNLPYHVLISLILCNLFVLVFRKNPQKLSILLLLCTVLLFAYIAVLH